MLICDCYCYNCLCQIKEKLVQLAEKRKEMMYKWDDRWDWLRLREYKHANLEPGNKSCTCLFSFRRSKLPEERMTNRCDGSYLCKPLRDQCQNKTLDLQ